MLPTFDLRLLALHAAVYVVGHDGVEVVHEIVVLGDERGFHGKYSLNMPKHNMYVLVGYTIIENVESSYIASFQLLYIGVPCCMKYR